MNHFGPAKDIAHYAHTPKSTCLTRYLVTRLRLRLRLALLKRRKESNGSKQPRVAVLLLAHAHARPGHRRGEAMLGVPLGHVAVRAAPVVPRARLLGHKVGVPH